MAVFWLFAGLTVFRLALALAVLGPIGDALVSIHPIAPLLWVGVIMPTLALAVVLVLAPRCKPWFSAVHSAGLVALVVSMFIIYQLTKLLPPSMLLR